MTKKISLILMIVVSLAVVSCGKKKDSASGTSSDSGGTSFFPIVNP